MLDIDKLLARLLGSGTAGGFLSGLIGGGAATAILRSRRGRRMATRALKLGGIAAIGALAYHAYTRYRADQDGGAALTPAPQPSELPAPPQGSAFLPATSDSKAVQSTGVTLIRAMIAAAKADGEIDAAESEQLLERINQPELDAEERAFLLSELTRRVEIDEIVGAATTPELAAEVFTASLVAIDESNEAEAAYLRRLALRLKLEPGLVDALRKAVVADTKTDA